MHIKSKWINIFTTLLSLLSMGELMLTTLLIFLLNDILYHAGGQYATICGFMTSLVTLPTAFKIKTIYGITELRLHHLDIINYYRYILYVCLLFQTVTIIVSLINLIHHTDALNSFVNSMTRYQINCSDKKFVDIIQFLFQCCGANDYLDWDRDVTIKKRFALHFYKLSSNLEPKISTISKKSISNNNSVPFSCCTLTSLEQCRNYNIKKYGISTINIDGCGDKLIGFLASVLFSELTIYIFILATILVLLSIIKADKSILVNDNWNEDAESINDIDDLPQYSHQPTNWEQFTNSALAKNKSPEIIPSAQTQLILEKPKCKTKI